MARPSGNRCILHTRTNATGRPPTNGSQSCAAGAVCVSRGNVGTMFRRLAEYGDGVQKKRHKLTQYDEELDMIRQRRCNRYRHRRFACVSIGMSSMYNKMMVAGLGNGPRLVLDRTSTHVSNYVDRALQWAETCARSDSTTFNFMWYAGPTCDCKSQCSDCPRTCTLI